MKKFILITIFILLIILDIQYCSNVHIIALSNNELTEYPQDEIFFEIKSDIKKSIFCGIYDFDEGNSIIFRPYFHTYVACKKSIKIILREIDITFNDVAEIIYECSDDKDY